jgi:hypothetical protein
VSANDRQVWKILVQTLNIRKPPDFNVEHDSLGMVPGYVLPQFFAGAGEMDRKVRA